MLNKILLVLFVFVIIFLAGCNEQIEKTENINREKPDIVKLQEKKELKLEDKKLNLSHDEVNVAEMPSEFISNDEIDALDKAIQDEYRAEATFKTVIDNFGEVYPFSVIVNSERIQIIELEKIYEKYDLQVPENTWTDFDPGFQSISEACEGGVQVQIANVILYNSLFAQVDNEDIIAVFNSLKNAAQFKHLGAFQKCVAKNSY